jgi:hypothetical protein
MVSMGPPGNRGPLPFLLAIRDYAWLCRPVRVVEGQPGVRSIHASLGQSGPESG